MQTSKAPPNNLLTEEDESKLLTGDGRLALYKSLDARIDEEYKEILYEALIKKVTPPTFAGMVDPITMESLPSESYKIFISAQGSVFDISNENGIILYIERLANKYFNKRREDFINPLTRERFSELDLKKLLEKVLVNDIITIENHKPYELVHEQIATYIKSITKAQVINIFKLRNYVKEVVKNSSKEEREKINLDLQLLYEIFADIHADLYEKIAYSKINQNDDVESYLAYALSYAGYPSVLIHAMLKFCEIKKIGISKNEASRQFVKENLCALLELGDKPDILNIVLNNKIFQDLIPFLTFPPIKNMNSNQSRIFKSLFSQSNINRVALFRSFLFKANNFKNTSEITITFDKLLNLDSSLFTEWFLNDKGYGFILDLLQYKYITFDEIIGLSRNEPDRLRSLAHGYEGMGIVHLLKVKNYSPEAILGNQELSMDLRALPLEQSNYNFARFWQPFKDKLDKLPANYTSNGAIDQIRSPEPTKNKKNLPSCIRCFFGG